MANQTRLNDPIKYGTIPFIGKSSVEPHIFEGIEASTCGKTIKSGFDAVSRLSNIDAKPADSLTYFLVTQNRVPLEEGSDDSDIEVYEDEPASTGNIKLSFFFYGITDERGEVRIPIVLANRSNVRIVSRARKEGLNGQG